jgi:hypothetical protein
MVDIFIILYIYTLIYTNIYLYIYIYLYLLIYKYIYIHTTCNIGFANIEAQMGDMLIMGMDGTFIDLDESRIAENSYSMSLYIHIALGSSVP